MRQYLGGLSNIPVATYVGFPDKRLLDQGLQSKREQFRSILLSAGIAQKGAGVESHNSFGETHRYLTILRKCFDCVA